MKIKCISNKCADMPESALRPEGGYGRNAVLPLVPGKEYIVYAMTVTEGYIWYYICDEDYHFLNYPVWKPCYLFSVSDGKLSKYWNYNFLAHNGQISCYPIWAFNEWTSDYGFFVS